MSSHFIRPLCRDVADAREASCNTHFSRPLISWGTDDNLSTRRSERCQVDVIATTRNESTTTTMCSTSTKSASVRRRPTVVILLLTVLLQGAVVPAARRPQTSSDTEELVALDELTRVFDVRRVSDYYDQRRRDSDDTRPHHVHHRSPPEYMVQLYSTIAYTDGISKTAAPYEADIVHGIPDKGKCTIVY